MQDFYAGHWTFGLKSNLRPRTELNGPSQPSLLLLLFIISFLHFQGAFCNVTAAAATLLKGLLSAWSLLCFYMTGATGLTFGRKRTNSCCSSNTTTPRTSPPVCRRHWPHCFFLSNTIKLPLAVALNVFHLTISGPLCVGFTWLRNRRISVCKAWWMSCWEMDGYPFRKVWQYPTVVK